MLVLRCEINNNRALSVGHRTNIKDNGTIWNGNQKCKYEYHYLKKNKKNTTSIFKLFCLYGNGYTLYNLKQGHFLNNQSIMSWRNVININLRSNIFKYKRPNKINNGKRHLDNSHHGSSLYDEPISVTRYWKAAKR